MIYWSKSDLFFNNSLCVLGPNCSQKILERSELKGGKRYKAPTAAIGSVFFQSLLMIFLQTPSLYTIQLGTCAYYEVIFSAPNSYFLTLWFWDGVLKPLLNFHLVFILYTFSSGSKSQYVLKNLCTPMFIAAQFTIAKCWKQCKCPPVNKWIKKLWYIYNGILCSRKKEGTATLHDSMDGTGEHYAKWNKPGGERQITYDLTYKWILINKSNKQTKYNWRHWNKEQTDSNQRRGRRGITGENKGRTIKEHVERTHGQSPRG